MVDVYEVVLIIIWAAVLAYIFQRRCLHKTYTLIMGDTAGRKDDDVNGVESGAR